MTKQLAQTNQRGRVSQTLIAEPAGKLLRIIARLQAQARKAART